MMRCNRWVLAGTLLVMLAYVYSLANHYIAFVSVTVPEDFCAHHFVTDEDAFSSSLLRRQKSIPTNHTEDVASSSLSPRIFTVFSTSCARSQDWQSQALLHNHRKLGIPGDLVRLMACRDANYSLPKHSYEKYRVVWTPDFDVDHPDDAYSPRNRPRSLDYWLHGHSRDAVEDLPRDNDILIQVDPDMIFLSNQMNISLVQPGVGIASEYGLHKQWLQGDLARATCQGKCQAPEEGYNPSYGHPMVLTAGDTRRHAKIWINVTEQMRLVKKEWMTEMYSNVVAHRLVGNTIVVLSTMLSTPWSPEHSPYFEPWDKVTWQAVPQGPGVWVAHYCQKYTVGDFTWYKHDHGSLDIRKCDRSQNFPTPSMEALAEMERWRNGKLQQDNLEQARLSRSVWMLDHAWNEVRTAIAAYYEEFC